MTNRPNRPDWARLSAAFVDGLADVVNVWHGGSAEPERDPTEPRDDAAELRAFVQRLVHHAVGYDAEAPLGPQVARAIAEINRVLALATERQRSIDDLTTTLHARTAEFEDVRRAQAQRAVTIRERDQAINRARAIITQVQTDKANLAAELDWYRRRYGRREAIEENQRLLDDATAQAVQHLPVDAPGLSGGSCRAVGHDTADHSHEPDVVTDEDVTLDILAVLPAHWPRELRSLVFDADVKVLDWRDQLTDALLSLVDDYVGYAQRYLLPYLVRRVDAAGLRSDVTRAQHDQLLRATGAGTTANPVAEPCD